MLYLSILACGGKLSIFTELLSYTPYYVDHLLYCSFFSSTLSGFELLRVCWLVGLVGFRLFIGLTTTYDFILPYG